MTRVMGYSQKFWAINFNQTYSIKENYNYHNTTNNKRHMGINVCKLTSPFLHGLDFPGLIKLVIIFYAFIFAICVRLRNQKTPTCTVSPF